MSIQDIAVSHNQLKKLLKAVKNETVVFQDDDGSVVVDVIGYIELKKETDSKPLEDVLGDDVALDIGAEFIVFS